MKPGKSLIDHDGQEAARLLEPEVRAYGPEIVLDALQALIPRARWADYERLWSLIRHLGARIQRET